jgi:hypothetical protein
MAKKNNISKKGYKANSPDRNKPYNVIESGRITMQNVPHPVLGIDEYGNQQMMMPGGEYNFPGNNVFELPIRQQGGVIEDPEMMYMDQYNTPLNKKEQASFDKWVGDENKKQGRNIMMDKGAYDVQGFWKSGAWKDRDSDGHGTDVYKKPNHPTFSTESQYIDENNPGGIWGEDGSYHAPASHKALYDQEYYKRTFGNEPNRPEHFGGYMGPSVTVIPNMQFGGLQNGINFNNFEAMNYMNQGGVPQGYHRMPDGTIMTDAEMMACGGRVRHQMQQGGPMVNNVPNPQMNPYTVTNPQMIQNVNDAETQKRLQHQQFIQNYATDTGLSPEETAKMIWEQDQLLMRQSPAMQEGGAYSIANQGAFDKMNTNQNPFYSTDQDYKAMAGRQERQSGNVNLPMMQQTMFPINMPDQSGVNIEVMPQNANMGPMLDRNQKRFNSIVENKEIDRMQAATRELGYKGPSLAKGGPMPSINQGAIMDAFLQLGGSGANPFKASIKKYYKGNVASQNQDTEDVLATRKNTMENYLSNTAMQAMAMQEAEQLSQSVNNYMQQGGNFGYNPNLYGQNQYMPQQNPSELIGQGFGDFRQASNTMIQGANPYVQTQYRMQNGGSTRVDAQNASPYLYNSGFNDAQYIDPGIHPDFDPVEFGRMYEFYQNLNPGQKAGRIDYDLPADIDPFPNYPVQYNTSDADVAQATDVVNDAVDNNARPEGTNVSTGVTTTPSGNAGNTGSADPNVGNVDPITPTYTAPGQENRPANFTGNYQGDPNAGRGSQLGQPAYVPGMPNYAGTGYQPVGGGYGMFPMNSNGRVKVRGSGFNSFNSPGFSNIIYDPNRITSIDQKKRLFGPGLRKQTIHFGPQGNGQGSQYPQNGGVGTGQGSGYPQEYDTMGNPIGSPDPKRDQYIENQIDSDLMSKKQHGDISPEEQIEWQRQYDEYAGNYDNSGARRAQGPITPPVKTSAGTKFKNWRQEREAEKTRKGRGRGGRNKKNESTFKSGVHPDYDPNKGNMSQQRQAGGPINMEQFFQSQMNSPQSLPQGTPMYGNTTAGQQVFQSPYSVNDPSMMQPDPMLQQYQNEPSVMGPMNQQQPLSPPMYGNTTQGQQLIPRYNPNLAYGGQHTGRNQYKGGNPLYQQGGGYVQPMDPTQMNTINNTPMVPPITGAFTYGPSSGKIVEKYKRGYNPEEAVAWGMAGMNAIASIPEAIDARKNEEKMKSRMFGDALFNPMQAGDVSRGDYETNRGTFRPDDHVPTQFTGQNFGQIGSPVQYEQGGEYDLTDAEIQQIMAMGGTVEYID